MKSKLLYIFLFLFIEFSISQNNKEMILEQIKKDVTILSSDKMKGRKIGTIGEKRAAKYIQKEFKKNKLLTRGTNGYYQYFTAQINSHHNPHSKSKKKTVKGINVIGFCDNNKQETIIIGAHYDHLGKIHKGSRHDGQPQIHNGADDNASGISLLTSLIDTLCTNKLYNYLFIAFSGEEDGLLGSSYFAKNPTIDLNKVKFMLNFDMVGRLNNKYELAINGTGTSNTWNNLIDQSNQFNFKIIKSKPGIGPSDHTSFYLQNIPAIHLFTGQHEDYHKPSDDVEKINFDGIYSIMCYVTNLIESSSLIDNFTFQETENPQSTPKFNVTLGIMPDYLFDGEGLRIDGVTKGKTAYKHKILKDDIIIRMGDLEVKDIMTYMESLSVFHSNDHTIITIKRKGEILKIPIVFD